MKKILIRTPKGEYNIDLQFVAEHRADYYSTTDNVQKDGPEWIEEVDWVMKDNFEGIDWLLNNMDFEDVEDIAEKVSDKVLVTDGDFWCDSEDFKIYDV